MCIPHETIYDSEGRPASAVIPWAEFQRLSDLMEGGFSTGSPAVSTDPAADPAKSWSDEITFLTCTRKCFGVDGESSGCCKLQQRDYILGPVADADAFMERLNRRTGRVRPVSEVLIGFEEGRNLFPEKSSWQNPAHYPALRVDASEDHACNFLGADGTCSVYEIRSLMCSSFKCGFLKQCLGMPVGE